MGRLLSKMSRPGGSRSVFVGNIPYEATEGQLQQIFELSGPVLNFRIMKDAEGKSRGFGFCEYRDAASALSAMRNLNGHTMDGGRPLRVNFPDNDRDEGDAAPPSAQVAEAMAKVKSTVSQLPPQQLHEIMTRMKELAETRPDQAKQTLQQNPQLAYALLQAQEVLGIPKHEDDKNSTRSGIQRLQPVQQQHRPPQQQQQQQHWKSNSRHQQGHQGNHQNNERPPVQLAPATQSYAPPPQQQHMRHGGQSFQQQQQHQQAPAAPAFDVAAATVQQLLTFTPAQMQSSGMAPDKIQQVLALQQQLRQQTGM